MLPAEPPLDTRARALLLTTVSICLCGVSPAPELARSLSRVPKQHGFGLTASVTASVTSSAPSPSAVTALPSLLDCYLRLVSRSCWPFGSVSGNDRGVLMQTHRATSEHKIKKYWIFIYIIFMYMNVFLPLRSYILEVHECVGKRNCWITWKLNHETPLGLIVTRTCPKCNFAKAG